MSNENSTAISRHRFQQLWSRCMDDQHDKNSQLINDMFDLLDAHYREAERHYHNWDHIAHSLQEFDHVSPLIDVPDALEMALWFHDVIFSPNAHDNEELSAELFKKMSKDILERSFIENVYDLIVITKHKSPPDKFDETFIVDIDLSGFGLPWPVYLRDTLKVRKEYVEKPDDVFYPMHKNFLHSLLHRPRIFYTQHFYDHYENIARDNINKLLNTKRYLYLT